MFSLPSGNDNEEDRKQKGRHIKHIKFMAALWKSKGRCKTFYYYQHKGQSKKVTHVMDLVIIIIIIIIIRPFGLKGYRSYCLL